MWRLFYRNYNITSHTKDIDYKLVGTTDIYNIIVSFLYIKIKLNQVEITSSKTPIFINFYKFNWRINCKSIFIIQ